METLLLESKIIAYFFRNQASDKSPFFIARTRRPLGENTFFLRRQVQRQKDSYMGDTNSFTMKSQIVLLSYP